MKSAYYLACLLLFSTGFLMAQGHVSLELTRVRFDEIKVGGFDLRQPRTIRIDAVGGGYDNVAKKYNEGFHDRFNMFVYAWILNAESRELVWRMTIDNTQKTGPVELMRAFTGDLNLPAGRYEAYLYARRPRTIIFDEGGLPSIKEILKRLLRGDEWEEAFKEESLLRISGVDEVYSNAEVLQQQRDIQSRAVVAINDLTSSDSREKRFTLSRPGEFQIYAVGEVLDNQVYDYGWILEEDRRQKVWEMSSDKSVYAGGANKNQQWRTTLALPAGNYSVHYMTDGSHAPGDWNANPPYDPAFWGVMLTGIPGKFDPGSVAEYQKPAQPRLLEITGVGNQRYIQEGFTLSRQTTVRIYALGEGSGRRMVDYGWIENAYTGEKIWEMTYDRTRHAGGADKNRMADETIVLAPGAYWVYYVSDDSHAYRDWNAAAPRDPGAWGITIYAEDPSFDRTEVRRFDEAQNQPVVALTRIGDDELVKQSFTIAHPAAFRIVALGEGRYNMADYGWIEESSSGRKVWEMRYAKTRHAGGSRKNRLTEEVITLPAGTYTVYFRTDGSHAYGDWNADAPPHPERWGITVYPLAPGSGEHARTLPAVPLAPTPALQAKPFITLTHIGDDELVHKRFSLSRETPLRILALGEGEEDEMYDYAWIDNTRDGRRVWEMHYRDTRPAGGADKNRRLEQTIVLPPGEYAVFYRSDDSHSFGDWNASPPRQPDMWGITLSADDPGSIQVYRDDAAPEGQLCSLLRPGNDAHMKCNFDLTRPTPVRIDALGEGSDGEMYDYGWLEDRRSGEKIWEMTYDLTRPAGGASKNRSATFSFTLAPGSYTLHYVTDGSHTYRKWNSAPPTSPEKYGITVSKLGN